MCICTMHNDKTNTIDFVTQASDIIVYIGLKVNLYKGITRQKHVNNATVKALTTNETYYSINSNTSKWYRYVTLPQYENEVRWQ